MNVKFPVKCTDTGEICYSYSDYLKSQHWQKLRVQYYNSGRYLRSVFYSKACECCGFVGPLDLHHRTYKRIGNENIEDLASVCRKCHENLHKLEKEGKHNIWTAPEVLRQKLNKKFRRKKKKPAFVRKIEQKKRDNLNAARKFERLLRKKDKFNYSKPIKRNNFIKPIGNIVTDELPLML